MSEYVQNQNHSTHVQDDALMPNALPARKMFSSIPVSEQQYTDDNRGNSMASIKKLAEHAKVGPGLKRAVPNTPR